MIYFLKREMSVKKENRVKTVKRENKVTKATRVTKGFKVLTDAWYVHQNGLQAWNTTTTAISPMAVCLSGI